MKSFIDSIVRYKGWVLFFTLIVTLILGYHIKNLRVNADFSTYLNSNDPLIKKFDYIGEVYGAKAVAAILVESKDLFSTETLKLIKNLTEAYEELEGVTHVTSLTNILDFRDVDGILEVKRLIPPEINIQSPDKLKKLKDYVLSKEMYVRDLVSEDGKYTIIVIRFNQKMDEFILSNQIMEVSDKTPKNGERIYFGGMPFLMNQMVIMIESTFTYLVPVMVGLMILFLFFGFRKIGGIVLPLVIVSLSVIWMIGVMVILGFKLDMLVAIVPVILIGMGSADGIHIMRRYYEMRHQGLSPTPAIKKTFEDLSTPIIVTTVTTVIGFFSLAISDFSAIQSFGLFSAIGILFALITTFLVFPALIPYSKNKPFREFSKIDEKEIFIINNFANFVFKNKFPILAGTCLIIISSLLIIPRISKSVDWTLCLEKGSLPHTGEIILRREFGGTVPIQFLVKGDIKNPETLKIMRYIEQYIESVPSLGEVQSISGVISEMNDVINGRYKIPQSKIGVGNLWSLIEEEKVIEQMVRNDKKEALIHARVNSWNSEVISTTVNEVDKFIRVLSDSFNREAPTDLYQSGLNRTVDSIFWMLQSKTADIDRDKIHSSINEAFNKQNFTEEEQKFINNKLINYLLSNNSEISIDSRSQAVKIAEKIDFLNSNNNTDLQMLSNNIKSILIKEDPEDIVELSRSLLQIDWEIRNKIKVNKAFQKIMKMILKDVKIDSDWTRKLKGTLWNLADKPSSVPDTISVESVGLAPVLKNMEEELTPTQLTSLFLALIVVSIVLIFIFRSISIGLITSIPIMITILINFAVMAYFEIGLDSFTAMVASVAIGLGIDTDVHFVTRFKQEFNKYKDELKALQETMKTTGLAILINTLTVGTGFAVLLFTSGQHLRRFGGLCSLSIFISAILTLTLLPSLLLFIKPDFLKRRP